MRKFPWLIVVGVLGWWGLNALISTIQWMAVMASRARPVVLHDVMVSEIASAAIWAVCTFWLLWCTARAPLERAHWRRPVAFLLLALVAAVLFRNAVVWLLVPWVEWNNRPPTAVDVLVGNMLKDFLRGCLIVGAGHALVYAQRSRAREAQEKILREQLTQARLDALSAQLNPHFLFNALNSIAEMVHHDADAADRMLVQLGALLRHSLESGRQQFTSLHDELAVIDSYIGIEQVRLGDRLRFSRDIAADALYAQVPRLMLQPLVENAVAHAVSHRDTPSNVEVRAWCEHERLVLEVLDEGAGKPAKQGFGMGLANTRARLECLYGEAQALDITTLPAGGTRVRVSLPLTQGAAS